MSQTADSNQLEVERARFVAVIRARGRGLIQDQLRDRIVGLIKGRVIATRLAEFHESYFRGQEYVECRSTVRCSIDAYFVYSGEIDGTRFWYRKCEIELAQHGPLLKVSLTRDIPTRLRDDVQVRMPGVCDLYLVGYIAAVMPEINRRLLDVRYKQGHLLSRTFHVREAFQVDLRCGTKTVRVRWPRAIGAFEPVAALAPAMNHLYLRELIDAMHALLRSEYDECIRRVITSAENFFKATGLDVSVRTGFVSRVLVALRLRTRTRRHSFRDCVRRCLAARGFGGEVLTENLIAVYGVRNRIVHGGHRLHPSSLTFCYKAVTSLRYMIYGQSGDPDVSRFAFYLQMQLMMLVDQGGEGFDLDSIARNTKQDAASRSAVQEAGGVPTATSRAEAMRMMDRDVFTWLRFDEADLSSTR